MSTLRTINVIHPSGSTTNIVNDNAGNVAVGGTLAMASSFKRNRILNGNMLIDQRNAGASVTPAIGVSTYTVDRWCTYQTQSSKFTIQQNAGSVTPPTGFTNYLGVTSSSAYSVISTDTFSVQQYIEGYNVSDLGWGTASAKTVTLSFQVYSSLTGTFGGALSNSAVSRSYPFSFTVASANTWTSVSVTVTGDTSGTWLTTNGVGIRVYFGLGVGTTQSGTAGAWASAQYQSATGAVSVVATSGATFYITGVQLEVGTKATPYEMQIYSDQLAQCQRYYYQGFLLAGIWGGTAIQALLSTPVPMRTTPTTGITGTGYLQFTDTVNVGVSQSVAGWGLTSPTAQNLSANYQTFLWAAGDFAGLTSYRMYYQSDYTGGTNNLITLSAEL